MQSSADSDRREQSLKWELSQLQRKLQEAEGRNHELSEAVTSGIGIPTDLFNLTQ